MQNQKVIKLESLEELKGKPIAVAGVVIARDMQLPAVVLIGMDDTGDGEVSMVIQPGYEHIEHMAETLERTAAEIRRYAGLIDTYKPATPGMH